MSDPSPASTAAASGDLGEALARFAEEVPAAPAEPPRPRAHSVWDAALALAVAAAVAVALDAEGLLAWAQRLDVGAVQSAVLGVLRPVSDGTGAIGLAAPRRALAQAGVDVAAAFGAQEDPLLAEGWVAPEELHAVGSTGAVATGQRVSASGEVTGSSGTVLGATGTVAGATGTVAGATGTVAGATGTVAGATGTVAGATGTVAGATGTVAGATGTVAGATGTVAGATGTAAGATGTHGGTTGTVSGATGTVAGATGTLAGTPGMVVGAAGASALGAGASGASPPANGDGSAAFLLLGDSMIAGSLGTSLRAALERGGHFQVAHAYQLGTGLARPDVYDWMKVLPPLLERERPRFVVVSLGGNDGTNIRDGDDVLDFGSPRWRQVYGARVEAMMRTLAVEDTRVLWLGLPPMRDARLGRRAAHLNAVFAATARKVPRAEFLELGMLVSPGDGRYATFLQGPDGRLVRYRLDDGVHLAPAGSRAIARWVLDWVRERNR